MDLFGTAGIRGDARTEVTPSLAMAVGQAAGSPGTEFVVSRDGRVTGEALAAAVAAGLASAGAEVHQIGPVPTPALAFASRGRRGVMVTASHNPPHDNGLKLFVDGTEYDRQAEREIEDAVSDEPQPAPWDAWGGIDRIEVLEDYLEAATGYVRDVVGGIADCRVAVGCGNGMGGVATPQVLRALGAEVVAINANVDGHFPARPSKPTLESLAGFRTFVADGTFDVAVAHDGDADRIVVLDGDGEIVHEDTILAIVAGFYTRSSDAADPVVVTTPNASARIDDHVRTAGGRVERVRLGALHEGVADALAAGGDDTDVVFAAEPWKHIHPAFGPWIDGVASAGVICALVARDGLQALRGPIPERPYRKVNIACPDDRKAAAMQSLAETLPDVFPEATVDTEYGIRLEFPDAAWLLVRPSGTEPYIRIYAESEDVDSLVERTRTAVEDATGV